MTVPGLLYEEFEVGQTFDLTLEFAESDPVVVPVTVYETEP